MEPLTALGIAANIAQFLGYGTKLIATAREVHRSTEGLTQQIATLETVYGELSTVSSTFKLSSQPPGKLGWDAVAYEKSIQDIARVCQDDCDTLLELTKQLKRVFMELTNISIWQSTYIGQLSKLRDDQKGLALYQNSKFEQIKHEVENLRRFLHTEASSATDATVHGSNIIALEEQMAHLSLARSDLEKQHAIVRSLNFESRSCRFEAIPEAHNKTFRWVLEEVENMDPELASGSVLEWLRYGQGIYWVSGKPGAGKSTLMKFVISHCKTAKSLQIWSSGRRLVVGSYYFWAAGTAMQKSWYGLLRTLLFDILRQQPDLVESLCPERWRQSLEQLSFKSEDWATLELSRALQRIPGIPTIATNFCFFIDGLDEYEGDHVEICTALKELSMSPNVKLCVASRSWNVFEDAFGGSTKMYIHKFTRQDIHAYVETSLNQHPRWAELNQESTRATSLIDEVTGKSAGVFLWVYLTIRELRSGLSEYDSFTELEQRLEIIPDDLGEFFRKILETVDTFHHQAMAEALLLSMAVREPAPTTVYYYLDRDRVDPEYALTLPLRPWSAEEVLSNCKRTARRLNARCRGLLQVNSSSSCVEPLHRTVLDYLRTKDMRDFLGAKMRLGFDADLSAVRAFIACIKSTQFGEHVRSTGFACCNENTFTKLFRQALIHSKLVKESSDAYRLLEHLETSISEMQRTRQVSLFVPDNPPDSDAVFVREMVINELLHGYVDYMVRRNANYFSVFLQPVMVNALEFLAQRSVMPDKSWIPLIKVLIGHEHRQKRSYSIESTLLSPWIFILQRCFLWSFPDSAILFPVLESGLLHLMLLNKADPYLLLAQGQRKDGPKAARSKLWLYYFVSKLTENRPSAKAMTCAIQVLDQTVIAFTTLQSRERTDAYNASVGTPEGFFKNLALNVLLEKLPSSCGEQGLSFWAQVAERLLTMAKLHMIETGEFLPFLHLKFPRHFVSPVPTGDDAADATVCGVE
ncbi:hypothetical protein PG984_011804 [Apiospora sp. TS-2023a]